MKKRLGSKKLDDGKPIGGVGRLPDRMVDLLQTYFGMAVRTNTGDLQKMARAAWASLMHKVAFEDPAVRHRYCPEGASSWCGWQQEKAGGDPYVPKDSIPVAVFGVLKPIWMQLTDKSLLSKCVRGATQNRNEAWNGMLWSICPKTKFGGVDVIELCAALMTARFNHGMGVYGSILEEMGIARGTYTACALQCEDDTHLSCAARKAQRR